MAPLIPGTIASVDEHQEHKETTLQKYLTYTIRVGRALHCVHGSQTELEFLKLPFGFMLLVGVLWTRFFTVCSLHISSIIENVLH